MCFTLTDNNETWHEEWYLPILASPSTQVGLYLYLSFGFKKVIVTPLC